MVLVKLNIANEKGQLVEKNYGLDIQKGTTVLQVLETVFEQKEPTLAYRYSCRTGLCGTCGVMVNGKPGLSCMKQAETGDDGVLTIEPLPHGQTIRGLVKKL